MPKVSDIQETLLNHLKVASFVFFANVQTLNSGGFQSASAKAARVLAELERLPKSPELSISDVTD